MVKTDIARMINYESPQWQQITDILFDRPPLSEAELLAREQYLQSTPDDLIARVEVISYFYKERLLDQGMIPHALWVMEHHPELSDVLFLIGGYFHWSRPAYFEAENIWRDHLKRYCDKPSVLLNASLFLELDLDAEEELHILLSQNPEVVQLGLRSLFEWRVSQLKITAPSARKDAAVRALDVLSRYLGSTEDDSNEHNVPYHDAALCHLLAQDLDQSEQYARKGLEFARRQLSVDSEREQYDSLVLLGLIAVERGNLSSAEIYLGEAATLTIEFPSLELAEALLRKGRRRSVCECLRRHPDRTYKRISYGRIADEIESGRFWCLHEDPAFEVSEKGLVLCRAGQLERARRYFELASQLEQQGTLTKFSCGLLAAELGETLIATTALQEALQRHPELRDKVREKDAAKALLRL